MVDVGTYRTPEGYQVVIDHDEFSSEYILDRIDGTSVVVYSYDGGNYRIEYNYEAAPTSFSELSSMSGVSEFDLAQILLGKSVAEIVHEVLTDGVFWDGYAIDMEYEDWFSGLPLDVSSEEVLEMFEDEFGEDAVEELVVNQAEAYFDEELGGFERIPFQAVLRPDPMNPSLLEKLEDKGVVYSDLAADRDALILWFRKEDSGVADGVKPYLEGEFYSIVLKDEDGDFMDGIGGVRYDEIAETLKELGVDPDSLEEE